MTWTLSKRSVLVPYDFSEAAKVALDVARTFVAGPERVAVLHVILPPPITAPGRLVRGPFDEEQATTEGFSALRQALADRDCAKMEPHVKVGHAAEEIVDFAATMRVELIVIPSNQRKGLDRLFLGSVAERVVRTSPCPVLVLRADEPGVVES